MKNKFINEHQNTYDFSAQAEVNAVLASLDSSVDGLTKEAAEDSRKKYGINTITHEEKESLLSIWNRTNHHIY